MLFQNVLWVLCDLIIAFKLWPVAGKGQAKGIHPPKNVGHSFERSVEPP